MSAPAPQPTEDALVEPLVRAAKAAGWWVSHDPDSRHQEPGEPDLWFVWRGSGACPGPRPELLVECKRRGNHRTDEQRRLANLLVVYGRCVLEWRLPDDYDQAEALLGLEAGTLTGRAPASPSGDTWRRQVDPLAARVRELEAEGQQPLAARRIAEAEAADKARREAVR